MHEQIKNAFFYYCQSTEQQVVSQIGGKTHNSVNKIRLDF